MLMHENEILLGVKDHIELLISQLDAAGTFTGDLADGCQNGIFKWQFRRGHLHAATRRVHS